MAKAPGGWQGQRGSTTERGYGAAWRRVRAAALARDMHLCQPCKADNRLTPATEVDHITPKAKGGTDEAENLQAICSGCHKAKTEREAAEAQGRKPRPEIGLDGWPV